VIELYIENPKVQTGTVPLSWCVSRDTLEHLAKTEIKEPLVLIVVAPTGDARCRRGRPAGATQPLRVADLPREKRTVRLRLANLKAKACRPFAAS